MNSAVEIPSYLPVPTGAELLTILAIFVELESNVSIILINSHLAMEGSLALLPNQVMVGGMRLRLGRPLPHPLPSQWECLYIGRTHFTVSCPSA
ncbi:hypothetical protein FHG87_014839 [Trinorchestia longiramus]|nr:hypothetical protein FHG87_014839 [Trinorchestia longiramus]